MKPSEKMQALAREQLAALTRQASEINRQIEEYQAILATLERLGQGPQLSLPEPAGGTAPDGRSFGARIEWILRSTTRAMTAREVADALLASGYVYSGSVPLRVAVSSELARQARRGKAAIRKVSVGEYTSAA